MDIDIIGKLNDWTLITLFHLLSAPPGLIKFWNYEVRRLLEGGAS